MNPAQALELAVAARRFAELLEAAVGEVDQGSAHDLSVAEVGKVLGRSESTIRGWLEKDELHGYKLPATDQKRAAWRVTSDALEAFRNRGTSRTSISDWRKGRAA